MLNIWYGCMWYAHKSWSLRSKLAKEADSIPSHRSEDKGRTNDKCGLIELDFEELDDNTMVTTDVWNYGPIIDFADTILYRSW